LHIFIKMEKKVIGISEEIELKPGIVAKMDGKELVIEKSNQKVKRRINPIITAVIENNKIILKTKKSGRVEKRMIGSMVAHLKNAVTGLENPFKYKLQVSNVHFPMTITHDKSANEIVVKNFLGEKKDRKIKIRDNVVVHINKDIIELESFDIENAGQTAANIEKGTKVRFRDRRIFQDGIFIIEKPGKVFLWKEENKNFW